MLEKLGFVEDLGLEALLDLLALGLRLVVQPGVAGALLGYMLELLDEPSDGGYALLLVVLVDDAVHPAIVLVPTLGGRRATPLEVRQAIGDCEIVDLYRSSEAKARTAARVAAETAKAEAAQALASATAKERRRLRQKRRRAAAEMLAAGMTQVATAEALGVSDRTIRNWAKGKAFQGALARAQTRAERQGARAERRAARRRAAIEQQNESSSSGSVMNR